MDYTITPQYHDKKGCYIYVVRLSDRVDKENFASLSDLAKKYKGYYSSFRGVNGFVFKREELAEQFCEDMVVILDTIKTSSAASSPSAPTKEDSYTPLSSTQSGMELHEALRAVIQTEGEAIITEVRLVNILDDFKAYSDMPTAKYILRAIIADGFARKLLVIGKWNNNAIKLVSCFISTTGFIPEMANLIFKSIAYGLGWVNEWEKFESLKNDKYSSINPQTSSQSSSLSHNFAKKWSKKMNDDETEEFLMSILEYDEEGANKYKVSIENLHFIVDDDEDIFISCELRKKYRKEYCVNLLFALYDSKGRLRYSSDHHDKCVGYLDSNDRGTKPVTCYFTEVKASDIGKIKLYWKSPDFY